MIKNDSRWRTPVYLILLAVYILAAATGVSLVHSHADVSASSEWTYRAPWSSQETTVTHAPNHPPFPHTFDIDYIVSVVHQLESSGGIYDGCKKHGLVNGYGYRQTKRSFKCYGSAEEVRDIVVEWFSRKLIEEQLSLPVTLCGYNLGFRHPHLQDCVARSDRYPYYQNYLKISST